MSDKEKASRTISPAPLVPREVISTCQIQTDAGTSVTWTAYRRRDASPTDLPEYFVCTLPDNTVDDTPSEYNLKSISVQSRVRNIQIKVLDRDVVYFITDSSTGETTEKSVPRGDFFEVPIRSKAQVVISFEGDTCTLQAWPNWKQPSVPKQQQQALATAAADEASGDSPFKGLDDDGGPPPPLPDCEP